MAAPVIVTNTLSPSTVTPGGDATWRTIASDPDGDSYPINRQVSDSSGNTVVFTNTLIVQDPLTYGAPTCDDPRVTFQVDPGDATVVHVHVAS